jgi:hypothetical protein
MNQTNDSEADIRPMTADEILQCVKRQCDAANRRYGGEESDTTICRSLPRKAARKITKRETKKLSEFGEYFYGSISDHYWMGLYPNEDAPYIEESLEALPDGSVRYTATFLPTRFAPDLPEQQSE